MFIDLSVYVIIFFIEMVLFDLFSNNNIIIMYMNFKYILIVKFDISGLSV